MKNIKEVSDFCNEFTFYDQYNIDRVIELNCIRDYTINVLSGSDFKHEDNRIRVMGIIDHSLKVIDGDVGNIEREISNLKFAILKMSRLEILYIEKDNEKRLIFIIDG